MNNEELIIERKNIEKLHESIIEIKNEILEQKQKIADLSGYDEEFD